MAKEKQWFKWTVEFQVHRAWVEDGFEITEERAKAMIENALAFSNGWETKAKILSAPDPDAIAKEQGYKDAILVTVAHRKAREEANERA